MSVEHADVVAAVCRDRSIMCCAASLARHSIRLLPAAETEQLDRRAADVFTWASQAPALYLSQGSCDDAGMIPTLLLALLQQQLFASVAYTAAMHAVGSGAGAAAEASWAPVQQVRSPAEIILQIC
jgi:hypothetical protein